MLGRETATRQTRTAEGDDIHTTQARQSIPRQSSQSVAVKEQTYTRGACEAAAGAGLVVHASSLLLDQLHQGLEERLEEGRGQQRAHEPRRRRRQQQLVQVYATHLPRQRLDDVKHADRYSVNRGGQGGRGSPTWGSVLISWYGSLLLLTRSEGWSGSGQARG